MKLLASPVTVVTLLLLTGAVIMGRATHPRFAMDEFICRARLLGTGIYGVCAQGTPGAETMLFLPLLANTDNGYTRYWQPEAQVPWLYNPATQLMISYDDPESIGAKGDYIVAQSLGGAMIWELSADSTTNDSLLNTLHQHLNP